MNFDQQHPLKIVWTKYSRLNNGNVLVSEAYVSPDNIRQMETGVMIDIPGNGVTMTFIPWSRVEYIEQIRTGWKTCLA